MPELTLEDIPMDTVNVDAPKPGTKPKWSPGQSKASSGRQPAASTDELRDFLIAVHSSIAKLPKQEHWQISRDEADSISKPLSRVMARNSSAGRFLSEHADTLLLCGALLGVVGSRVVTTVMGGTSNGNEEPVSSNRDDTRTARLRRLLRSEPKPESGATASANGNAHRAESNGSVVNDPTADALRDSLRNVPI